MSSVPVILKKIITENKLIRLVFCFLILIPAVHTSAEPRKDYAPDQPEVWKNVFKGELMPPPGLHKQAAVQSTSGINNPTAPNEQTKILRGDFTDTDGDGMTDAAEEKYGFDPSDPNSFPRSPPKVIDPPDTDIGDESNYISYTFTNFSSSQEETWSNFIDKVWPIMRAYLGPPAETFNCEINNRGNSRSFMIVKDGREFLCDGNFIPRLIVHEFIHAWKGDYTFTSDEDWNYHKDLSGFEEMTGEGMAFEIVHEFVRSFPDDPASIKLLDWRPYQYWNYGTTHYDDMRHIRWTAAGPFWTHTGGQTNRYTIAAVTCQILMKKNPDFYLTLMEKYYETINADSAWRPNRTDLVNMIEDIVPVVNGVPTGLYLDKMPVFQGHKADEGFHILATIRPYGLTGTQQFCGTYVLNNGKFWWGASKSKMAEYKVPDWVPWDPGSDNYNYINMQGQPIEIKVHSSSRLQGTYNIKTSIDKRDDGTANGFGWVMADDLDHEKFPAGLYRETVTFTNIIEHDESARENFYFFGVQDLTMDKNNDYMIMIGVDGAEEGRVTITIQDNDYTENISNSAAVFTSTQWPFDLEGEFPITVTSGGKTHTYYRTLIEAGTYHNYFQHQFIIVDRDFNGVEDVYANDIAATGAFLPSEEPEEKKNLRISKGPGSIDFSLDLKEQAIVEIAIYTTAGKTVWSNIYSGMTGSRTFKVPTGSLNTGTYLAEITTGSFRERRIVPLMNGL